MEDVDYGYEDTFDLAEMESRYNNLDHDTIDADRLLDDFGRLDDHLMNDQMSEAERSDAEAFHDTLAYHIASRGPRGEVFGEPFREVRGTDTAKKEEDSLGERRLTEITTGVGAFEEIKNLTPAEKAEMEQAMKISSDTVEGLEARVVRLQRELDKSNKRITELEKTGKDPKKVESLKGATFILKLEEGKTKGRIEQKKDLGRLARFSNFVTDLFGGGRLTTLLKRIAELTVALLLFSRKFGGAVSTVIKDAGKRATDFVKGTFPQLSPVISLMGNALQNGGDSIAWLSRNMWAIILIPLAIMLYNLFRR